MDPSDEEDRFTPRVTEGASGVPVETHNNTFGQWEKYTRGIGSKLMAKMGYVYGSGLGRGGEGRTEPVQAMVFPPGRSLGT